MSTLLFSSQTTFLTVLSISASSALIWQELLQPTAPHLAACNSCLSGFLQVLIKASCSLLIIQSSMSNVLYSPWVYILERAIAHLLYCSK